MILSLQNIWQEDFTNIYKSVQDAFKIPDLNKLPHLDFNPLVSRYLPIEYFRSNQDPQVKINGLFQGIEQEISFLSSGTTTEMKANSLFSKDGLELYKAASLKTFHAVLHEFWGNSCFFPGISLVPKANFLPQSSLAKMVYWISQVWPVSYCSSERSVNEIKRFIEAVTTKNQPIFIFGTAVNFANLIDQGLRVHLPKESLVIETGGFKSTRYNLSRKCLYENISRNFHIGEERIISEYGMAEFSVQAYDWVSPNSSCTKDKRGYRFPSWSMAGVMEGFGKITSEGNGALTIFDLCRIDFPWPIRTQDLVSLKNKEISLLGRVPNAPLKGCSLTSEELALSPIISKTLTPTIAKNTINRKLIFDETTISKFFDCFLSFISGNDTELSLSQDLGSVAAARSALHDIKESLPQNTAAWLSALKDASDLSQEITESPEIWLYILPSSHALAGLYPLSFGLLSGQKIFVRLPSEYAEKNSFLEKFITLLKNFGQITILPPDFRLGTSSLPSGIQAILCFGESATIEEIRGLTPCQIKGFGSSLTISVLHSSEFKHLSREIIKDAFSLGQRGCMSSRLLFIIGEPSSLSPKEVNNGLCIEFNRFWNSPLPFPSKIALDQETLRLTTHSKALILRKSLDEPLFPIFTVHRKALFSQSLNELLSPLPFSLPTFLLEAKEISEVLFDFLTWLKSSPDIKTVSYSKKLANFAHNLEAPPSLVNVRPLGAANIPPWNGYYEGFPLFTFK